MRALSALENLSLGKEYLLNYKRVASFPYLEASEISQYQFERIKKLVMLAYYNTDFYHELYSSKNIHPDDIKSWEDFQALPTITKEDVLANYSKCIVRNKAKDEKLIISRSSGSSGKLIDVAFDAKSWIQQALISLRMFQAAFDYKPLDRQALIYTSKYPYRSIMGLYRARYINTLSSSEDIIRKLKKLKPTVIVAYPSMLLDLIARDEDWCKRAHIKAISTNSEQSTPQQRGFIGSVFGCPVFDEYSTEELTLVAYQCKQKQYHLQEDCSYIEILALNEDKVLPDGRVGEITGTCLVNDVMPLIRYRQGDLGSLQASSCACKSNARILRDISGRKNSSFTLKDGTVIPAMKILDWTYKLFLEFRLPILQFHIIQQAVDFIEVIIVPGKLYDKATHDKVITSSFKTEFGALLIKITEVAQLPRTAAGKHIPIESKVTRA